VKESGALGAERSFVDRMIGIPFDVEDLSRQLVGAADQAASHRTVAADGGRLLGRPDPIHFGQTGRVSLQRRQVKTKRRQSDSRPY